jgi:peptidoglycan hydrolase-like protein with peptidoglycan-binding domain
MLGTSLRAAFQRSITVLALVATTGVGLAVAAGPASAATRPGPGAVGTTSALARSCGYYSGTQNTVRGNTGDRVKEAQCLVRNWGYYIGPTGVDGDFGGYTYSAVVAFQSDRHWLYQNGYCSKDLGIDGQVGPHTWSALRSSDSCPTV